MVERGDDKVPSKARGVDRRGRDGRTMVLGDPGIDLVGRGAGDEEEGRFVGE